MPPGVILPSNVTQFPAEPAIAADKEKLDHQRQQIDEIVKGFNELKQTLVIDSDQTRKAQFSALLDQRREAIETAMAAWKAKAAQLGIGQHPPTLQGLGAIDLTSLQTQIGAEQAKLTALTSYYAAYKVAVDSGQAPPALPPELATGGFLGISTGTIALIAGLIAGAYFLFARK